MARTVKKEKVMTPEEKLAKALVPEDEQPYPIPENWCWTKLTNLITTSKDKTEDFSDPSTKYVGLENMEKDSGIVSYGFVDGVKSPKNVFVEGQILYGKLRPYLNKHDVATFDGVCSTDILVFDVKETTINRFINYFFNLQSFIEYTVSNSKGINLPRVSENVVLDSLCPLPPFAEQQCIVDRIESMFAKLDEAKEKAQSVVDGFEDRKAAILHKAFTGELTAEWRKKQGYTITEWQTKKVSDIGEIITGSTPSTKHPEYYNGPVPFVKPTELNQGRNVVASAETLTEQGKAVSRPIRAGSTCICCIGATISKCGLVSVDCVTNQQINTIVPYNFMDDVFVYYYCCSNKFKNELIANSSATTLPIINKSKTSDLQFVIPPREEQHQIACILDWLFEKEQQAKEAAEQVIDQIDAMKKSILARAFRGELGTNDPTDESAEELLKRIL